MSISKSSPNCTVCSAGTTIKSPIFAGKNPLTSMIAPDCKEDVGILKENILNNSLSNLFVSNLLPTILPEILSTIFSL